jgi:hypothetical protein
MSQLTTYLAPLYRSMYLNYELTSPKEPVEIVMDCAPYILDRMIHFWLTKTVAIDEKKKLNFALSEDENVNVAELSTTETLIAMCVFAKTYDDEAVSNVPVCTTCM